MMKEKIKKWLQSFGRQVAMASESRDETSLLALGALLSKQQFGMQSNNLNDYEFKIFSQFGDDGIIQFLIKHIVIKNEIFIEFGVENYLESNTRFLMMHNNWTGFVMDGSATAMQILVQQPWYWKYNLTQKAVFIDKDNINELLAATGFKEIGLLHIDIDGNDYHIFNALDLSLLSPAIIIAEYNSVFGSDRLITVPYQKDFYRTKAHYSNLYAGASLPALNHVANAKGYALVGCNLAGNNAYFVKRELLTEKVKEVPLEMAFMESKFRESRNSDFTFSYLSGASRLELIKGLDVLNVATGKLEKC